MTDGVINKWQNLRDYYKKRKKIYESGNGCMAKRWIYFDAMQFLDPYEHSNRDNGSSNIGLINLSELSSGSSRSNDAVPEHVIITEPADNRDHYFDETQYHSLDGIAERAEVKISHFLEPPTENYPPSKKQRVASTNAGGSNTILTSTPITAAASSSTAHTSRHCSHHHHHHGSTAEVVTPSIVSVQSKAESQSQNRNSEKQQSSCKTEVANSNEDCPHYHFCMSLLARFKKMTPANAIFAQMKIMEAVMRTEYPEEFKKRTEDSS
ncbi:hypothetical protein Ocin01_07507 [Orchesella cincta]|uniref:MADF domain-containing protein n=1 Tax=Orchesella cincta TaxID=48709 RepID=A0A1D2N1L9_ORCCI|nr:hypothetical protein Ocin01_07507 [Orchesella cincta]